jgi:hypothetical protein
MPKLDKPVYNKVDLQDNIYFARIKDIKLKVWTEENKSLNWSFELAQPPHLGKSVLVWGSTSTTPTPKARLTQFGAALGYTREALADESFDTDSLVGSYVKIFLETTLKEDGSPKQHVTKLLALTEVDTQILQGYLAQAQLTGPAKVAVQATAPVSHIPSVTFNNGVPAQPVAPVVSQPTVPSPVGSPALATTPRRAGPIPF